MYKDETILIYLIEYCWTPSHHQLKKHLISCFLRIWRIFSKPPGISWRPFYFYIQLKRLKSLWFYKYIINEQSKRVYISLIFKLSCQYLPLGKNRTIFVIYLPERLIFDCSSIYQSPTECAEVRNSQKMLNL